MARFTDHKSGAVRESDFLQQTNSISGSSATKGKVVLPLVPEKSIGTNKAVEAVEIVVELMESPCEGLPVSSGRCLVKCLGVLLEFCDLDDWESVKLGFQTLMKYSIDKRPKVHQYARSFRDRYIPWYARRVNWADRDTERMEFHQTSSPKSFPLHPRLERRPSEDKSIKQSVSGPKLPVEGSSMSYVSSSTNGTRVRKRKSRWDEPGDIEYSLKKDFNSKFSGIEEQRENMDVDAPPGFHLRFTSAVSN